MVSPRAELAGVSKSRRRRSVRPDPFACPSRWFRAAVRMSATGTGRTVTTIMRAGARHEVGAERRSEPRGYHEHHE